MPLTWQAYIKLSTNVGVLFVYTADGDLLNSLLALMIFPCVLVVVWSSSERPHHLIREFGEIGGDLCTLNHLV